MTPSPQPANPWGVLGWALPVAAGLLAGASAVIWPWAGYSAALATVVHGAAMFGVLLLTLCPLLLGGRTLTGTSQKLAFVVLGLTFIQMLVTIAWIGVVVIWLSRSPWGAAGAGAAFFAVLFAECTWATRALRRWVESDEVSP